MRLVLNVVWLLFGGLWLVLVPVDPTRVPA